MGIRLSDDIVHSCVLVYQQCSQDYVNSLPLINTLIACYLSASVVIDSCSVSVQFLHFFFSRP